jgi:alpha-1,2-mannosyltransferase
MVPASVLRFGASLRDAAWMTPERARAYARVLLILTLVVAAAWMLMSHGGLDRNGKPIGTDFIGFWTASKIALGGHPSDAYRPDSYCAAQAALMPGLKSCFAYFYPPVFLLICLPLALLPYLASLAVWLGATLFAYWRVVRGFVGNELGALPIFAFPAVLVNAGHGQNGFLTTALLGGGILALKRRPILAGVLLGALIFKPHLGLMIPVALIAAGRFKAFASASATVAALIGVSWLVFGSDTWHAFFEASKFARATLEQGLVDPAKMQSSFAAIRLVGGSIPLAYSVQGLVALAAAGALVFLIRARPESAAAGPALAGATLLASPFLFDYDLAILAIPLGWLASAGVRRGFLPWEKLTLLLGFVLPLVSRSLAVSLGIPIGPVVIALVMAAVVRRGLTEA